MASTAESPHRLPDRRILLAVRGISAGYGRRRVIHSYSRDFPCGIYVIVGANGSGKTTVMKALCGIVELDCGEVVVADSDLRGEPLAARHAIGYAPADPEAYPFMTGRDLIELVLMAKGMRDDGGAEDLIARFGMKLDLGRSFASMSLGMRRKCFLIAALLGDPPVVLLDEPSNGLDESARKALVGLIADRRSHAVTLIASHDRTIVADLEATIVPWPPST